MIKLLIILLLAASPPLQSLEVTLTWSGNPLKNEDGFRIYQCVGASCTPSEIISSDLPPGTLSYLDRIDNDPGNRVICYQGEYFNSAGKIKGPIGCITTPPIVPVISPPQAPGPFQFDIKVLPATVSGIQKIPGSTNGWMEGRYSWFGPKECLDSGFLPSAGSDAIDGGLLDPSIHCPSPGPSLAGCVEWSGRAPDIGACELISDQPII